ncbi:MAG: SRPBCC family protein [Verrucomicrobiota bacterium]
MYRFERSIVIRAPLEKVYDFHQYTPNARLIQPWGIQVLEVEQPEEVRPGVEFNLVVRAYGMTQRWRVRWAEVQPPRKLEGEAAADGLRQAHLTDESLRGPFAAFRHRHEFTETEPGVTRLRDAIEYLPPFGPLGRLLAPFFHFQLDGMFYTRQRMTKRILEASLAPTEAPLDLAQANAFFSVQAAADKSKGE